MSRGDSAWIKAFAVLVLLAMTILNILGSQAVAGAQTIVVYVVIGILTVFAVATLTHIHPHLLAFSRYPSLRDIVSSVALTFFAFLGFGVITFAATSLANPRHDLPRAMFLALGIATVIYVAVALGVFGTLTVQKVISSGGTALAVAAEPVLGSAGYHLMTVTALFATAGATNAGLFPAAGLSEAMAAAGQFPPLLGHRVAGRAVAGLLITCGAAIGLSLTFDLTAIASIGSAVALMVFALVTVAHLRLRRETGGSCAGLLVLALVSTVGVLLTFIFTTLVHEPATAFTLLGILVLSVALDFGWKRTRRDPCYFCPRVLAFMMPTPAALPQQEIVRLDGHLLDSMVLPKVLDAIADAGASYAILELDVGATRIDHSHIRLEVSCREEAALAALLEGLQVHGVNVESDENAELVEADRGRCPA